MRKILMTAICASCLLMGCSSTGVPQEEYESVVAERDEYRAALESLTTNSDNDGQEKTQEPEITNTANDVDGSVPLENAVEIVSDYTLVDGLGWYTRHFLIIKNNSNQAVDVSTSSLAYSADDTMVSAADASFYALGAGCTSIMYEAFETDAEIDHYETTLNVVESEYYDSVIQDLEYVQNDIDGGAVFQVTNNGEEPAEFVEGYALFFMGDELVDYNSTYFTDDELELKPGATISEQINSYADFDRIEFYLTGRRTDW